ncbi:MAG TPA: hypothetical protein VHD34_08170 [Xanthobacteraceae bacterium]|nr:hypothetical protein [Xanthobacteraceae bacterium]
MFRRRRDGIDAWVIDPVAFCRRKKRKREWPAKPALVSEAKA